MRLDVAVVDTGIANQASIFAALVRIGATPVMVTDPDALRRAPRVVLPGVGAFAPGMAMLRRHGVDSALRERMNNGGSILAICLGMQLLAESSDEAPGVAGIGAIGGAVRRLPPQTRVPQIGWNQVVPAQPGLVKAGCAFFANSYVLDDVDPSWQPAFAEHGRRFVAAAQRGAQLACQFHPELSGRWGQQLLADWCAAC